MRALSFAQKLILNSGGILIFFCCSFFLNSCSKNTAEKKIKIGFSQCTGSDYWRRTMLEGMKRQLSFHPGTTLLYKDAKDNSDLQVKQIKELIDANIDILLVSPNQAQPLTPIVEEAFNKGIPVVIIDRKISSGLFTSFVGADNFEIGKMAGNYIANILHGKGNVIEVIGLPGSSPAIERQRGLAEGTRDYPGIHITAQVYGNWTKDKSAEEVFKIKDKLPEADLVFAHNEVMALGAYEVYKKSGVQKRIRFIGVDGLPGPGGGIQFVSDKILDATMLYPTGGEESIETAFKILNKESFNKENILQTVVIDSTNVRLMKLQTDKINNQQKDIEKQQDILFEQQRIYNNQSTLLNIAIAALLLVIILGSIAFYSLSNNRKINRRLKLQNEEILLQRNQLIEMTARAKAATDAKVNFFIHISHEFRTPLTLIIGPLDDVLASPKLHFTIKNNLELARKNVLRLLRLINQLMDFRKIEESKMKLKASENNLIEFIEEITNAYDEIARKKFITFKIHTNLKELKTWFDVSMLDKVIFNLLSNAFKFTKEHGYINIHISKSDDDKMAIIKVQDSGVGMSPDVAEHAFDLFYQGHGASYQGSGLGLALSKELINLHHGTISLQSEKWKGTSFEIRLPLGKSHLEANEIAEPTSSEFTLYEDIKIYTADLEPAVLQKERTPVSVKEHSILLIEDFTDLRTFLKNRLENTYEIHEAENGNAGLNLAYEIVPDVIVCDIMLPGKDGLQITDILKNDIRTSHIPIIILTARESIEQQIEGLKLIADAYIVKPFNLEYLEENIKSILKNREILREHYTSELPGEIRASSPKKMDRKFINEFAAIVENNISNENFNIDILCKEIGVSRVQLYRKIKALLGYNVNDYIHNIRLNKAKFLLMNEETTISEVAFKVGFSSQAYFSTVFKSKFAITPSEYKEKSKR